MYKYLQQLILIPIILCMFSYNVFAADSKVSALAELAVTPADTDEMYINDGGTSKKIQYSNVMSGEAATAAALAADPTDCAANQFADVIAANGNLTCSAIVDADIPDDITITNAVYTTDFPLNQDTTGSAASTTGNSATATALAANGANCAADHYALGVDASGAVESCTADANTTYASSDFTLSDIGGSVTDAQVPDDITITLAGTATALAADPANCVTATHFAVGVDAGGVAECEAIADADVPNDITITLAATATASADNPTDCAAGSYPLGVDANWDVANCTDASTEIDSIVATHMAIVGTTSITGHITDTDWDTFNNKAPTTSPTFATSITGSYLTASELLSTNASSEIVSLAVATYPSLTELSYVKGLSSAIQTQLNAKAPSASPTITTKMTLDYATASELVSTNASKELVSLAVATYPSLTELSYVKGLSSAVQTQLNAEKHQLCFFIDGGGSAVTTGAKAWVRATNSFTVGGAEITSDTSTTSIVDIWVEQYADYPPIDADSITSATPPTLTTAVKAQDTTLTSWSTTITAGDYIRANVDSNDNATLLEVCIYE